ncbi:MAG: hypothetical protein AAFV93_16510, partial [Chloroflexota bacterium]
WEYHFQWGNITLGYHYETQDNTFVIFDYHYQIKTWEAFIADCNYRFQHLIYPPRPIKPLIPIIQEALNSLSKHFSYLALRPRLYSSGSIGFVVNFEAKPNHSYNYSVKGVLDINLNNTEYQFNISRTDSGTSWDTTLDGLPILIQKAITGEGFDIK